MLIGFQGITAHTAQYGDFPMFGPETTTLNDADLDSYCRDILAAGFTHGEIAVSWQYDEPGFLVPVPGRDLTNDLPELCRRIARMLVNGLTGVLVFMAGDGRSLPKNPDGTYPYNDPVGHTYGYEWLIENGPRIWRAIMAAGLNRSCIAVPGYDGVFPGWDNHPGEGPDQMPQRVGHFADVMRAVDPEMLIFLEHGAGWLPLGEGHAIPDFGPGGLMENYDGVLSEFDTNVHNDAVWQIVPRLNPDGYVRPNDQPAGDDPHPPMINVPTARGKRYYSRYEYRTIDWTKGRCVKADVDADRAYLQALGPGPVC